MELGEGSASRPGCFLPPGKTRYPLYRSPGGPQDRSGQVRKISPPTGIRSPDRPTRSQSLYRLSYPTPSSNSSSISVVVVTVAIVVILVVIACCNRIQRSSSSNSSSSSFNSSKTSSSSSSSSSFNSSKSSIGVVVVLIVLKVVLVVVVVVVVVAVIRGPSQKKCTERSNYRIEHQMCIKVL